MVRIEAAEIACRRVMSSIDSVAYDHAVVAKFCVVNCDIRGRADDAIAVIKGLLPKFSFAYAHAVFVRSYAIN